MLHLLTNGRYGYFRDELYFIACGHHLAWGYVDQPPLIALIARVSDVLSFGSLTLFRLPAALAHTASVLGAGWLAARLGGRSFAQLIAGLAVAISPTFLVGGHLLTMNAFEPLFWLAAAACVLDLMEGRPRGTALGIAIGLGLLNKHSMAFYALALVIGLLLTPHRKLLSSKQAAIAFATATALAAPHAIWQIAGGLPMLELLRNGQLYKNAPFSPASFVAGQFLEQHPINDVVWIAGLYFLLARARPLGIAHLTIFALFLVLKAKVYYLAPAYPILFAAGGAQLERIIARARWALPALMVAGGAATAPLVIPVLTVDRMLALQDFYGIEPPRLEQQAYNALPQHLADQFGWEGLADAVARAHRDLSPEERAGVIILARNYGQAGAIDHFGKARGLPPASSGHNNYWLWGPQGRGDVVILIGGRIEEHRRACREVFEAARTPDDPYALPSESGLPIYVCKGLTRPIEELWPEQKRYI